jgi:hypothetical protein
MGSQKSTREAAAQLTHKHPHPFPPHTRTRMRLDPSSIDSGRSSSLWGSKTQAGRGATRPRSTTAKSIHSLVVSLIALSSASPIGCTPLFRADVALAAVFPANFLMNLNPVWF